MSTEIKYDKLVRDKIPQIIMNSGKEFSTHVADNEEYKNKLLSKVQEELAEFKANPSEEEMADIFEVLDSIIKSWDLNYNKIRNIKSEKRDKRGGFDKRVILEKVIENN